MVPQHRMPDCSSACVSPSMYSLETWKQRADALIHPGWDSKIMHRFSAGPASKRDVWHQSHSSFYTLLYFLHIGIGFFLSLCQCICVLTNHTYERACTHSKMKKMKKKEKKKNEEIWIHSQNPRRVPGFTVVVVTFFVKILDDFHDCVSECVSFQRKINDPFCGVTVFQKKSDNFHWT